jgi:hypothetical protein
MNAILMVGLAAVMLITGVLVGHILKSRLNDIRDRKLAQNNDEVRQREYELQERLHQLKTGGPGPGGVA